MSTGEEYLKNNKFTAANGISANQSETNARNLELSGEPRLFLGQQVRTNTSRNNMVSLRALCKFVLVTVCKQNISPYSIGKMLYKTHCYMFPSGHGGYLADDVDTVDCATLIRVRQILFEFIAQ